jgi:hypothetical protein
MIAPKPHVHPKSKRLPERSAVTICIAAEATHEGEPVVVAVSDTKITSGGLYSQEMGASKIRRIHEYWFALIAGQFSQHRAICDAIEDKLAGIDDPSMSTVEQTATEVYISETKRFAEEGILSAFGMSMSDFVKSRETIGDSLFERTWVEISKIQIGCDLLIFGFSNTRRGRFPHIFSVSNPTTDRPTFITNHDSPSFAAIGSGLYAAESILYAFRHTVINTLYETIYQVCTAKYFAESASDVGELTMLNIIKGDGSWMEIDVGLANDLRERWKTNGKLKIPEKEIQWIKESITQSTSRKSEPEK